jgi:hypothetical protein
MVRRHVARAQQEAVAMGKKLEPLERRKAKERQKEHGGTAPGKPKNTGEKFSPVNAADGKTRNKVAQALGMSGPTYEKAKAVVAAAKSERKKKPFRQIAGRVFSPCPSPKKNRNIPETFRNVA